MSRKLIDAGAVAEKLRCSRRHVARLVIAGKMPAPVRLGAIVRWDESEVDRWIEAGCPACTGVFRGGAADER